jgi:hypothetical protein
MKSLDKRQKHKLLSRLYWDKKVDPEHLSRLVDGEIKDETEADVLNFYSRLLTTYDWYTILKLIPPENLKEILTDRIIAKLHPEELKTRFQYARRVLSK